MMTTDPLTCDRTCAFGQKEIVNVTREDWIDVLIHIIEGEIGKWRLFADNAMRTRDAPLEGNWKWTYIKKKINL